MLSVCSRLCCLVSTETLIVFLAYTIDPKTLSAPAPSMTFEESQNPSPPPWPTFGQQEKAHVRPAKIGPHGGATGVVTSSPHPRGVQEPHPRGVQEPHPRGGQEQKLFHAADIPEELRGVSVKDLVKALG